MKRILGLIAALAMLQVSAPARAQETVQAVTVSACGTPNNTPVVGRPYPVTQDPTGVLCTSSTGGGGGSATAANQTTQITAANLTNTNLGALGSTACATDTGSCSLNALIQRALQRLTTINATLGTPFQAGGSIGNTTFASTQSGTWNLANITGTISLPTGAATSALQGAQGTGSTYNPPTGGSGEIGYLSGIYAAAISTTPVPGNTTQINSVAIDVGAGAPGTGTQRVSVATGGSVQPVAGTTGGADPISKQVANNTTSVAICSAACTAYSVYVQSNSATIAYLKLYNAAQGSTTCGSGTPVDRIMIPASTSGAGAVVPLGAAGVAYGTALTSCVTTGFGDSDTTAPAANAYQFTIYKK